MGRVTEIQRVEAANERDALGYFEVALRGLTDPRRRQGMRYPLRSVVAIALMAQVCGCDDAEAIEVWGEANAAWLSELLELPHGPPSQDVFLHVLGALDPVEFQKVYRSWAQLISLRLHGTERHIAIDGKTSRGSAAGRLRRPDARRRPPSCETTRGCQLRVRRIMSTRAGPLRRCNRSCGLDSYAVAATRV